MSQQAWDEWLAGRIYKADEFTVALGQGSAWEHTLRYFDVELRRDRQRDRSAFPPSSRGLDSWRHSTTKSAKKRASWALYPTTTCWWRQACRLS